MWPVGAVLDELAAATVGAAGPKLKVERVEDFAVQSAHREVSE
jgi:hypothetical protein